jgi:hypothetical protein
MFRFDPVAICDRMPRDDALVFFRRKLKYKIPRKSFPVSPELLVQPFRRHAVNARKIYIEHDFLTADSEYSNVRRFVPGCHDANLSFSSMPASRHIRQSTATRPVRDVVANCDQFKAAASNVAVCELKNFMKKSNSAGSRMQHASGPHAGG